MREVEVVKEDLTFCDLCGVQAKSRNWDSSTWGRGFDVKNVDIEIKIKAQEGEHYPEGSSGTEWRVDMCPECFKGKFIPWLISQGAKIEEKDYSF